MGEAGPKGGERERGEVCSVARGTNRYLVRRDVVHFLLGDLLVRINVGGPGKDFREPHDNVPLPCCDL